MNAKFVRLAVVMAVVCTAIGCSFTHREPPPSITPIPPASSHSTTVTTTSTTPRPTMPCPVGQIIDGSKCVDCPQLKPCYTMAGQMHAMADMIYPAIEEFSTDTFAGQIPHARWFVIATRNQIMTPCVPLESRSGPMYCGYDDTIYMGEDGMWDMYNTNDRGDAINVIVMAHEWGHHVQMHRGIMLMERPGERSVRQENQADCIAGAAAKFMHEKGYFTDDDLAGVESFIPNIPSDTGGTHGTNEQRMNAFMTGYENGIKSCNAIGNGDVA